MNEVGCVLVATEHHICGADDGDSTVSTMVDYYLACYLRAVHVIVIPLLGAEGPGGDCFGIAGLEGPCDCKGKARRENFFLDLEDKPVLDGYIQQVRQSATRRRKTGESMGNTALKAREANGQARLLPRASQAETVEVHISNLMYRDAVLKRRLELACRFLGLGVNILPERELRVPYANLYKRVDGKLVRTEQWLGLEDIRSQLFNRIMDILAHRQLGL